MPYFCTPAAGGDLLAARVEPFRTEGRGARYVFPPCTPRLGPVAVSAGREEITTPPHLPRSLSGAGFGRSPCSSIHRRPELASLHGDGMLS